MMVFWVVAALLLAGALLMLLPPLWRPPAADAAVAPSAVNLAIYRDQWREAERDLAQAALDGTQFAAARDDIRRRWLEEGAPTGAATPTAEPARRTALALALLLPLGSVLVYLQLGHPASLAPAAPVAAGTAPAGRHGVDVAQIRAMVAGLAERLKSEPANAEGWLMLGRSYTALGRYPDAAIAFTRAKDLLPGNADVLADLADLLAMAQGRRLAGEPSRLIQQALDADPRHLKALALAGSAAFEARDYAAARGHWERLVAVAPADSEMARSMQASIAQAVRLDAASRAGAGVTAADAATAPTASAVAGAPKLAAAAIPPVPVAGGRVAGEVRLADALVSKVAPGDTLFVFARAVDGPRMPVAILRRPVDRWPAPFSLDDSLAMSQALRISGAGRVVVGARVSRRGDATPQPGDLVGSSGPVAVGTTDLPIVIDRVQP